MYRIGFGYDVHRFESGRRLVLGGIDIPHEKGLLGHSDADVLLHAVTDAMLGALALGDIGSHFPDTDPAWKDADSGKLLRSIHGLVTERGWGIGNIDATIVAERPKLRPHIDAIRASIAGLLHVPVEDVSVKATTNERMGFAGREEGMAVHCVVMLIRNTSS
jgi:2-C-methyl-D-erythritol 2,4-cyclodiphosphate synthase